MPTPTLKEPSHMPTPSTSSLVTSPPLACLRPQPDKLGTQVPMLPDVQIEQKVTVTVSGEWLALCTLWTDLFGHDYIGYWARGIAQDDKLGWLLLDMDNFEEFDADDHEVREKQAVAAWRAGTELPPAYYRLDREAAVHAFLAMIRRKGFGWYDNGDATDYDVAIQLALFGKIVYG